MSYEYSTLDNIITTRKRELATYEANLEAWRKVKRATKKDGSNFSAFSKNFTDCKINNASYSMHGNDEKEINVYGYSPVCGYVSDSISLHESLSQYRKCEKAERKPENVKVYGGFCSDVYVFDVEDTEQAIKARIEWIENQITETKKSIETVSEKVKKADELINQLGELIKDDFDKYAIREYVEHNLYKVC